MNKSKEFTKLDLLVEKLQKSKDEFSKEGRLILKEETDKIFEKYPKLKSFNWKQYTPYFCDGDICEFGVDSYSIGINGSDTDDSEYDDDGNEIIESGNEWKRDASEEISELIEQFPENILKDLFDDHVVVTCTRKRFTTEEYEHD